MEYSHDRHIPFFGMRNIPIVPVIGIIPIIRICLLILVILLEYAGIFLNSQ